MFSVEMSKIITGIVVEALCCSAFMLVLYGINLILS